MTAPALNPHYSLNAALKTGASFSNGVAVNERIYTGGASRFRGRWKSTGGGTLSFTFLRHDGTTAYSTLNPGSVAVVANTETSFTVDPHYGEKYLTITFTPSADGTITYFDISTL